MPEEEQYVRLVDVLNGSIFPSKKTLRRPILLYVRRALTMHYVAKVSRARIKSSRPINPMLSRTQLAL